MLIQTLKPINKWCLCLAAILCCVNGLFSQPSFSKDNFHFEVFALPGGAMANQVQQVVQDSTGFLWFATKGGLIKYDGRAFKTFQHQPDNPHSLPSNFVECLFFDSQGNFWVGTYGKGVALFDRNTEQFSKPLQLGKMMTRAENIYVYAFEEDDKHNVWIGANGGLVKYNLITQNTHYFSEDITNPKALKSHIVWNVYKDKQGTIWIGSGFPWMYDPTVGGLHRYNALTNDFTRYEHLPNTPSSLADNRVGALFEDSRNNFWVGTMGEGLHLMNRQTGTFQRLGYSHNPKDAISRPYIEDPKFSPKDFSQVTFVHEDALGRLWIGAFNGGLNIYDPKVNQQIHFENNNADKSSLLTNYIFNIFETRDNTVFLCTGDGGGNQLIKVSYAEPLFTREQLPKKEFGQGHIQSMVEDQAGNVWIGTKYGEGLFQWQPKAGRINPHPLFLTSKNINALGIDGLGDLWIGYDQSGFQVLNPSTNQLVTTDYLEVIKQATESESINTVFEDSEQNIWIPRRSNGVSILRKDKSIIHLTKENAPPTALSAKTVDKILEDDKGKIWLFGNYQMLNGIYSLTIDEYDPTTNAVVSHLQQGQESGYISSVDRDAIGNFWFTNGLDGIKKYNPITKELITLNTSNSRIPSDEILALLISKTGIIWMQTKKKIVAYHPEQEVFRIFGELDGVNMDFWYGSILERKNGHILFGGQDGFLTINPKRLDWQQQFEKPKVVITNLNIDNQNISSDTELLSNKPIWKQNQLILEYNQNNFSFGLSCLDYDKKGHYIEHFLENYDSYWRPVGPEQIAHYVNVPPGNYTLKTRGANNQGGWNDKGQSISIKVKTPWWQTWWAYLIYLITGTGLIYSFYRFQLKRQAEQQEAQQLKEIDALKTKLYANVTHEFRTPLTLILGQTQQLQQIENLEQTINTKVKSIEKNGQQLLHLVNQLLDIRKLEAKEESLNIVQGDIVALLHHIADSFESLAISRGIDYQVHLPHPPLMMDYDAEKIQKIVANLVSNAIKFTTKGNAVTLFVQRLEDALIINVKDSGIGMEADALPHIFNRFYRADNSHQVGGTGIGLALTKELVDLLQGQIQVTSQLGIGSEFIVKLPITNLAAKTIPSFSPIVALEAPASMILPTTGLEGTNLPIVLIVEDNQEVAQFTASCLKGQYAIQFAENGQIGIEKALELIPDIIISDVMMPLKDGLELCEVIKQDERTSHIPIILLTARTDIEDKIAGLSRGADAYLAKPFHDKELKIRIEQLIQLREKLKERYAGLALKKPSTDKALKLDDEFVLKVRATIEEHLDDEQFGVEELSKTIFLSRAQVHRKIKALTGKSTGQFIHTVRLHHALQFLQEKDKSITNIAFDVGYNDPSYFTRMFTREFGQPPSYFAKKSV